MADTITAVRIVCSIAYRAVKTVYLLPINPRKGYFLPINHNKETSFVYWTEEVFCLIYAKPCGIFIPINRCLKG